MDSASLELSLNTRKTYISKTMTIFFHHLSGIQDMSQRLSELNKFIHQLEQESDKIFGFSRDLPVCRLLLQDAINALKEEEENIKKNMLGIHALKKKETFVTQTCSIFDSQHTAVTPNTANDYEDQMEAIREKFRSSRQGALFLSSDQNENTHHQPKVYMGINRLNQPVKISDGKGAFKPYVRNYVQPTAADRGKQIAEEASRLQQPSLVLHARKCGCSAAKDKGKQIKEEQIESHIELPLSLPASRGTYALNLSPRKKPDAEAIWRSDRRF